MRLAYLFSRYPVVSQTFCDTEILALERLGFELELYSIYPPPTSFRHGHAQRMKAGIHYAPPSPILKLGEAAARKSGRWPAELVAEHEQRFGPEYKAALRARNALYFADLFRARGLTHFHVHFANRAAHTAIFLRAISGIPFSISTHGQDFMSDLGSPALLREMCATAEFVANETNFSKEWVARVCPESAGKMHRVFNGMELANFPASTAMTCNPVPRILSVGRLIEFKGFHHLISACARLRWRGVPFQCDILGEGPWRSRLQEQIDHLELGDQVHLPGALPQEEIFGALRSCDIFALACTTDEKGASDVFPTVILEAMASAKPVVSTRLAGVPEQIVDGVSGLMVEAGDEVALAEALERLLTSPEDRRRLGQGGRERLEKEFSVDHTVLELKRLFEQHVTPAPPLAPQSAKLAVLLPAWPPEGGTAAELRHLAAAVPSLRVHVGGVTGAPPTAAALELLPHFEFLPDGMVLEAEWQQERELARRIETWRAELGQKLPSELYLRLARHALYLRPRLAFAGIAHLHALGAEALLTGWILHRLTGLTLSVTLEDKEAQVPGTVIARLVQDCVRVRIVPGAAGGKAIEAGHAPGLSWHKRGQHLEPEFLAQVAVWSGTEAAAPV